MARKGRYRAAGLRNSVLNLMWQVGVCDLSLAGSVIPGYIHTLPHLDPLR